MKNILLLLISSFFMNDEANATAFTDSTYKETLITLHTTTGDIYGTFTTPVKFKKIPVALIIAGSGPTDRNGNNAMMKNDGLKMLAHNLVNENIASIRYDKRGIAESIKAAKSEADLRFEDYVNDAKEWIDLLKKDKRFSKVIVIGHSEGSLIGMIAALSNADKYISIAGAGQSADKILKEQLASQPQGIKDISFAVIDTLAMGKKVANINPMFYSIFRPSVQPYLISWFKYDPQTEIKKLTIPILILQGTNDIQVSTEDAKRLSKANKKSKFVLLINMNHILKITEGNRDANIATYNKPTLAISEELVRSIVLFINKK
jgi:pimeloyl-ACP methyl ester carboxylesterase